MRYAFPPYIIAIRFAIALVLNVIASLSAAAQTIIAKNHLTGRPYVGCYSLEKYDAVIAGKLTGRTLSAVFSTGECFGLKTGERVFVVSDNYPYAGVIKLRRAGQSKVFWTSSMAIEQR